ncbi:unnamed protein product [Thelazia callipaeda]|uniref:HP domain-containing protein n=1 Tax=Thelazia callipaeda TaxID=103827 RepID=A0A0N5CQU5_THECL|nr:unnamed protein product [Thelazia callipaeda]
MLAEGSGCVPISDVKKAVEFTKHALIQFDILDKLFTLLKISAEQWRNRIKTDSELQNLSGKKRLQKDFPTKEIRKEQPNTLDIGKGLDRFYSNLSCISSLGKTFEINCSEFEDAISSYPKLVVPIRAAVRGRKRRSKRNSSRQFCNSSVQVTDLHSDNFVQKVDDKVSDEVGISSSAKKGLQSKLDYSTVKLKKPEVKSVYPELMLLRLKGEKYVDVRLVAPRYTSVHAFAVFILLTPNRLFLFHGKYANLLEKSKALIITTSICEKNGELGCKVKHCENVHEGKGVREFWHLLGLNEIEIDGNIRGEYVPDNLLTLSEPFESLAAQVNTIYEVNEQHIMKQISTAEVPKLSFLHPNKNLIFDFGSEIYVWVGRNANRQQTQQAVIYAEKLRRKGLRIQAGMDYQVIFGDSFEIGRPDWCIVVKLIQGLHDSLFQHKFYNWQVVPWHNINCTTKCKQKITSSPISLQSEEEEAHNLGRNLACQVVEEPVLIFEETMLSRNCSNIFTENIRYFIMEGEKKLREMNDLWILENNRCYVVKWEYRIERGGVRKLDGSEREKETGRPRVAYFYWLGKKSSKTEQGLCALALRDYDKEHFPHERILQHYEPPLFLRLFKGVMVIRGEGSGIFLVYSSSSHPEESFIEELSSPVIYRSHAVYIILTDDRITILKGLNSYANLKSAAQRFAENIKLHFKLFLQFTSEPTIIHCDLSKDGNYSVIEADNWEKPPRLFRLYEKYAEELICANWDPLLPFSFRQESFRDNIMVDQGNRLWLWSNKMITTFVLRVADAYWSSHKGVKTVIYKKQEPDAFKALFAEWNDYNDDNDENVIMINYLRLSLFVRAREISQVLKGIHYEPTDLDKLLQLRTKTWPLEQVINRDLPAGTDTNRLEQYLTEDDFQSVFRMERHAFYALPLWKQIELRKKNKLF